MPIERDIRRIPANEATRFRAGLTLHAAPVGGKPGKEFPFSPGARRMRGLIEVVQRRPIYGSKGRGLCEHTLVEVDAHSDRARWAVKSVQLVGDERTYQIDSDGPRVFAALKELRPTVEGREKKWAHVEALVQYLTRLKESGYSERSVEIIVAALANIEDQSRTTENLEHCKTVQAIAEAIAWRFEVRHARQRRDSMTDQDATNEILRQLSDQIHREVFAIVVRLGERQEGGTYASETASVVTHHEVLNILSKARDPLLYAMARDELARQMKKQAEQAIKSSRQFHEVYRARHTAQEKLIPQRSKLEAARLDREAEAKRTEMQALESELTAQGDAPDAKLQKRVERLKTWLDNLPRLKREAEARLRKDMGETILEKMMAEIEEGQKAWAKNLHARRNDRQQLDDLELNRVAPWTALLSEADAAEFARLSTVIGSGEAGKPDVEDARVKLANMRFCAQRFFTAAEQKSRQESPEILGQELADGLRFWSEHAGDAGVQSQFRAIVESDLGGAFSRKLNVHQHGFQRAVTKIDRLRQRLVDLAKTAQLPGVSESEVEKKFYSCLAEQPYGILAAHSIQDSHAAFRFEMGGKYRQAAMVMALMASGYREAVLKRLEAQVVAFLHEKAQTVAQSDLEKRQAQILQHLEASPDGKEILGVLTTAFAGRSPRERKELMSAAVVGLLSDFHHHLNKRRDKSSPSFANRAFSQLDEFLDLLAQGGTVSAAVAELNLEVEVMGLPAYLEALKARTQEMLRFYDQDGDRLREAFLAAARQSSNVLVGQLLEELGPELHKNPNLIGIMLRNFAAEEWVEMSGVAQGSGAEETLEVKCAAKLVAVVERELNRSWENFLKHAQHDPSRSSGRFEEAADKHAVRKMAAGVRVSMDIAQRNCDEELQRLNAFIFPSALLERQMRDYVENRHKEVRHMVDVERDGMQIVRFKLHRLIYTVTDHFDYQAAVAARLRRITWERRKRKSIERGDFHNHPLEHSDPSDTDRNGALTSCFEGDTYDPKQKKKPIGAYYGIFSFAADLADPYSQVNLYMDFGPDFPIERVPVWFVESDAGTQVGEDFVYEVPRGAVPDRENHHDDVLDIFRTMIKAERKTPVATAAQLQAKVRV